MAWGKYIKVKPDALREVAGKADSIGESLHKQVSFARDESSGASAKHQGFQTSGALDGCLHAWEENVRRLADSVGGVGDKLRQTADNYVAADQRGAERMPR